MNLPLAKLFCRMPPVITLSHAPPLRQPIIDDTFILPLIQPKNPLKQDVETLQPPPGSPSLQHPAQGLQVIHQTIQQFHQHSKAQQLDRKILQLYFLQLHNDFALLRYLLFIQLEQFPSVILSLKTRLLVP